MTSGSEHASRIVVAICTHRRPDSLLRALGSLARLEDVPGAEVTVCVVDNTPEHELRGREQELSQAAGREVELVHEPRTGRPIARNTAVRRARELGGDWLAFIDDDEVADPGWVRELVAAARRFAAPVVSGHTRPQYPDEAPEWFAEANGQQPPTGVAGSAVRTFSTSNVLLDLSLFDDPDRWFDESLAGHSGEDSDLARRLRLAGVAMVLAPDARTVEIFTPGRARLGWLLRRGMTVGAHEGRRRILDAGWRGRLFSLVRGPIRVVVRTMLALVWFARSPNERGRAARQAFLAARGVGLTMGGFGRLPGYHSKRR